MRGFIALAWLCSILLALVSLEEAELGKWASSAFIGLMAALCAAVALHEWRQL